MIFYAFNIMDVIKKGMQLINMYGDLRRIPLSNDTLSIVVAYMIEIDKYGNITWGGLREGIWIIYYTGYGYEHETIYVHDGLSTIYNDPMPNIKEQCYYHNNIPQGLFQKWNEYGSLIERYTLVDGKRHGLYESWYGSVMLSVRGTYIYGRLHGEYKTWDRDGKLELDKVYQHGKRVGWNIRDVIRGLLR